ncbi:MAG: elongation factor G [Alphaproteobacteria bacterium]|nr:elongation factor G [Alphaproteobacteria bacterium]
MVERKSSGARTVALVGPSLSGKTTLMESLLFAAEALKRKGSVVAGSSVGDAAPEARARQIGVELNVAQCEFMGDRYALLDCPGSIEFLQETLNAVRGADLAVVVCESDPARAPMLKPFLHALEEAGIPRIAFVNKIDRSGVAAAAMIEALQQVSAVPVVMRQFPLVESGRTVGYVDMANQRAYRYADHAASARIELPADAKTVEGEARYKMLEALADRDDRLMSDLLEEKEPEVGTVFADLTRDMREGRILPVMLGSAEHDNGIRRLWKALRHETPEAAVAAARLGLEAAGPPVAQVLKTWHSPQGKLSVARVFRGPLHDGATLNGERAGGLFRLMGQRPDKTSEVQAGEVVAIARLEKARTGDTLSTAEVDPLPRAESLFPVYGLALAAADRKDDVKLSGALHRLVDEDTGLGFGHDPDTHELILSGQGEVHLRVAFERMKNRNGLVVAARAPRVPYKEAIKKGTTQHGRHKRQTGGHGQFGDVKINIKPRQRGSGFEFVNAVVGGAIPKNFIPAVEEGVREYLAKGPLGFPVVDVSVELFDGQYHDVDSSEMAFKTAGRIAMQEGLPNCAPVLLEPICKVRIHIPNAVTAKANALVSTHRGRVLGFDGRAGWQGWDTVEALMPRAELQGMIVELRSLSQGVGTFDWQFDHLAELTGRLAEQAMQQDKAHAA